MSSVPLDRSEALDLAKCDFAGLHEQHSSAWRGFNETLRVLVILEALPWFVAGTVVGRQDAAISSFEFASTLPKLVVYSLFFTGLSGIVGVIVLIHNRLDILLYARALNGLRGLYAEQLPEVKQLMPVSRELPRVPEFQGLMLLLYVAMAAINCFYLTVGVAGETGSGYLGVAAGFASLLFLLIWYLVVSHAPPIEGWSPPS